MRQMMIALLTLAAPIAQAQTIEERVAALEQAAKLQQKEVAESKYMPRLHGILRGKYEYQPEMDASRFEVRNARLSASGALPGKADYKLEIDLCDESAIKMKDAWVRLLPWRTLGISIGQQRLPFSIDAHRNPSAQYFANRSFIAKQVGDMRDVGLKLSYSFAHSGRDIAAIDAGLFNGSNLDSQKTAWHGDWNYSARVQLFPIPGLAIVPSIQRTAIAERQVHYTSLDFGSYWEHGGLHIEAEYLRKRYDHGAFSSVNAVNAMAIYRQPLRKSWFEAISPLVRYDYMDDHSDGKKGFDAATGKLALTDAERHRMTVGLTFSVANKWFPTDIRLNYERYWYPHGGTPKESEQDKLVAEVMVRF